MPAALHSERSNGSSIAARPLVLGSPPQFDRRPETPVKKGAPSQGKLWSNIYEVCNLLRLPCSGSNADVKPLFQHMKFKTGQRIHTVGQVFDTLYVVNSGFLKMVLIDEFGNEQVLSFPMMGDILGVDSIHSKFYSTEAVALSDCNLILIPFSALLELSRKGAEFEQLIYNVLSRELMRKQALVSLLAVPKADARVARFLIYLSEKFHEMGYSKTMFSLRMTRQEIGSYLGLSLETVSRAMSALNAVGVIDVDQRSIKINEGDIFKLIGGISTPKQRMAPYIAKKPAMPVMKDEWAGHLQ
jgi:CRP/FNR family transcriptional regulator